MRKLLTLCFSVAILFASTQAFAQVPTVVYRILIDGDDSATQMLPAGTYELDIQAQVINNLIGPNSDILGGLFQSSVSLGETGNSLAFEPGDDGFGGATPDWNSTFNTNFNTTIPGVRDFNSFDVAGQTGAISPPFEFADVGLIGAGSFTSVFSGNFDYDGGDTVLSLTPGAPNEHLIAAFSGAVGAAFPGAVDGGNSITLGGGMIPEPNSLLLSCLGMLGLFASRRRK